MRDVVEQALATSRPMVDAKAHSIAVDLSDEVLTVEGDGVRLVQIVSNLLNNAARYTPRGGVVRVAYGRVDDHVELRVADNGRGIREEALSRVFEPFSQEESGHAGGLGLGLAIVRRLVALHGGTVSAHSDGPGCGSEFVVRLPLAAGIASASESLAPPPNAVSAAH